MPYFRLTLKNALIGLGVVFAAAIVLAVSVVGAVVLGVVLAVSCAVSALGGRAGSVGSSRRRFLRSSALEAHRDADGSYRIGGDGAP